MVKAEADILREVTDKILNQGISYRAITKDLRLRKVKNTHGDTNWTSQSLKNVLRKPAIAGLAVHKGTLYPAPWEAILKPDVWERLCQRIESDKCDNGNEPIWLLSGIAKCGVCDNGTPVNTTGPAGKKVYRCREFCHLKRRVPKCDLWVEYNVTAYLSQHGSEVLKPETRPDINVDELRAEAKDISKRQDEQLSLHARGLIPTDKLEKSLRQFADRLAVIDAQLAKSDEPDPIPEFRHHGPARETWFALPLERKRAILAKLVDIRILPTGRGSQFDKSAVEIIVKETGNRLDVEQWPNAEGFAAFQAQLAHSKG